MSSGSASTDKTADIVESKEKIQDKNWLKIPFTKSEAEQEKTNFLTPLNRALLEKLFVNGSEEEMLSLLSAAILSMQQSNTGQFKSDFYK